MNSSAALKDIIKELHAVKDSLVEILDEMPGDKAESVDDALEAIDDAIDSLNDAAED